MAANSSGKGTVMIVSACFEQLPGRLMAGQRPLKPYVEVRILPGQHYRNLSRMRESIEALRLR